MSTQRGIKVMLVDEHGQMRVIPGEVVPTKFRSQVFAVHKSLGIDDSLWGVTHVASMATLGFRDTKAAALEAAKEILSKLTADELVAKVDAAMARKPSVTVGEYARTMAGL